MFVFAKLLSFLPFGNIFRGVSGKFILYGVIAAAIAFGLWWIRGEIRDGALDDFNREQTVIINEQQQKSFEDYQEINREQENIISELISDRTELQQELNALRVQIGSHGTETPANGALKDAVRGISAIQENTPRLKPSVPENEESNSYLDEWRRKITGTL